MPAWSKRPPAQEVPELPWVVHPLPIQPCRGPSLPLPCHQSSACTQSSWTQQGQSTYGKNVVSSSQVGQVRNHVGHGSNEQPRQQVAGLSSVPTGVAMSPWRRGRPATHKRLRSRPEDIGWASGAINEVGQMKMVLVILLLTV